MKIISAYNAEGIWLKGNLHTHTNHSSCGNFSLEDVVSVYSDHILRYDFLAITDHCMLTDVRAVQGTNGMIIFGGVEYKPKNLQVLGISINSYKDDIRNDENHEEIFDDVHRQGGFAVICHPHANRHDYWPLEKLLRIRGYDAIEIYNHNVKMNCSGNAVASDLWDKLLTQGYRVFGIACDDSHHCSRYGGGFIMVKSARKDGEAIINAIKAGAFYASSGIILREISLVDSRIIRITSDSPIGSDIQFRFIGINGKLLVEQYGQEAVYYINGNEGYVRVEAFHENGSRAWTQPFLIQ
jgi:histidinol phosphatase-like PHP family hydrolase